MKKSFPLLLATLAFCACGSVPENPDPAESIPAETAVPADEPTFEERDFAQEAVLGFLKTNNFEAALKTAVESQKTAEVYYIAECVLETAELENFIKQNYPAEPADVPAASDEEIPIDGRAEVVRELYYTLARRLMRENLPARARPFFPKPLLPAFDEYVKTVKAAYNIELDATARAKAFWEAAMIVRGNGDALFASFVSPQDLENREFCSEREEARVRSRNNDDPAVAVRRRAAKLAFLSASLLPNDEERTARILLTAGTWLRARDIEFADTFYKLIAVRCPKTEIGRECIRLHWLPASIPWKREQTWDGAD